ncbi:MAG: hypothetical protein LBT70_01600 [Holosporaceae bacterium]|nr:hypothetical protein [Holosporaceae bacterium]
MLRWKNQRLRRRPGKYCVMKPLEQLRDEEEPLVMTFFARGKSHVNGIEV